MLDKFPIRLGISAEVDVDITDQDLPRLAIKPVDKTVAKTSVFNIHLENGNEMMNKIVNDNLIIEKANIKKMLDELQNPLFSEPIKK